MADAIYTVVLDLTDDGCIETGWRLKQGDSGLSKIVAKVVNNGVDAFDPSATPEIAFKRADGNSVLSTMVANNGYYEYTFVGNEISVAGRVVMDVTFTDSESRISTCSARFEVVENPAGYDPEGAHTYDNPVSVLVERATEDALIAEGFAVGQQRGQDVQESSPYYHNNAKYYSDLTDPTALRNMSDVDVEGVQNGQTLKWNSTTSKWENGSGGGGASSLGDLSDVSLENLQTFNQLLYDSETETWFNGFTMYYLNNLVDVSISSPNAGQVLKYSGGLLGSWSNSTLTKSDVGLGNVDNTSDLDKPISTATQTALNAKASTTDVNNKHKVSNFEVSTTGWTADTTSQSGTTLYKKQVSLSHVYANPSVDIGASTGNVLPTTSEQEAYDLVQYVTVDDTVPCLYLYASDTPTNAFNIDVEGVD